MGKPIHTPGPVEVDVKADKAPDGLPFEDCYISSAAEGFYNGRIIADTFNSDHVFTEKDRQANARLLAAAYNAFDSAARKLGVNAIELAERMQEGSIAELVTILERVVADADMPTKTIDDIDRQISAEIKTEDDSRALLAKVKVGAS